jgi:hypothetical protein
MIDEPQSDAEAVAGASVLLGALGIELARITDRVDRLASVLDQLARSMRDTPRP